MNAWFEVFTSVISNTILNKVDFLKTYTQVPVIASVALDVSVFFE